MRDQVILNSFVALAVCPLKDNLKSLLFVKVFLSSPLFLYVIAAFVNFDFDFDGDMFLGYSFSSST